MKIYIVTVRMLIFPGNICFYKTGYAFLFTLFSAQQVEIKFLQFFLKE